MDSHSESLGSPGVIGGARLRQLRSGHSHEDIDQLFGRLCSYIARHARTAATPREFCVHIQRWLDEKLDRPHELLRECVLMDQCRDWKLDGSHLEFAC